MHVHNNNAFPGVGEAPERTRPSCAVLFSFRASQAFT